MAKKIEPSTPKVTNLPLPISDTPLVIDLPDGQKIVIGKMQAGSVIEVATWRGTGRPDSRTNRLMMGMNSGASAAPSEATTDETKKVVASIPNDWKSKAVFIAKTILAATHDRISKLVAALKNRKPRAAKISHTNSSSSITTSSEVDEWLAKVLEKSEKKATRAAQKPASAKPRPAKKAAPKKRTTTKQSRKK